MNAPPRAPVVAGYEVLGLLGSGGLGSVWKARTAAGASVAIKVVEPRRPVDAAVADRLFRREALAGLNLDHPGIVKALDAVKARDGRPCIVFELAEGPTLRDAVKARGAIPPQEALWIATSLAAALDHAHRHGVVHGDVSPGNVLLSPAGARLLDFGLVAELEARPGRSVFATPGFTAPEVLAGGAPTAASDLHALGKTLAFALQGADHPLRAVVDRLCRDEPSARYRSAAELGLDLDALAAGETPLGAALAGAKARMAAPRRGPWILAGTALAVVAGVLLLRDPPAAPPPPAPPPSPAPIAAPDPLAGKVEALRVLLGRDPVDFGAARALAAEIAKAGRSDPVLDDLDARWRAAAKALAAAKEADAKAAFASGDRAAWRKTLLEWPAEFADAPEAAAARAEVERLDEAARKVAAMVDRHLGDIEKGLAALVPSSPTAAADLARMDTDLAMFQEDPVIPPEQRRRAGELRAKAGVASAAREKAAREVALKAAIEAFLHAAAKPEPMPQVRARLLDAIAAAEGSSLKAELDGIRSRAEEAQVELERALQGVVGKTWFVYQGEQSGAQVVTHAPSPDSAFLPGLVLYDVLVLVRDRERVASWLLTRGWATEALRVAPEAGPVQRVLATRGADALPCRDAAMDLFNALNHRLIGWETPVSAERDKAAPSLAAAVEAYVRDDLPTAWRELTKARELDGRNPEAFVLQARVLQGLAKPLPTAMIRCLALSSAHRAWELDPKMAAAPALVAEIALGLHEDLRPVERGYLSTVIRATKASIALGRASPKDLTALAERLHRDRDDDGARRVLLAAKDLGAPIPAWAADWFR